MCEYRRLTRLRLRRHSPSRESRAEETSDPFANDVGIDRLVKKWKAPLPGSGNFTD